MNSDDELKELAKEVGLAKVQEATGIPMSTLSSWANKPDADMRANSKAKIVAYLKKQQPESGELVVGGESFLPIPVYDIRAAAGPGAIVEDSDPISYQMFRQNFLRRLTRAGLQHLSVIEVTGDSMEPTVYGGDQVLVDHTVRAVDHGGLYILRLDGANILKRCEKDFSTKAVQIISDNARYPV